jgi:hypothetical protein
VAQRVQSQVMRNICLFGFLFLIGCIPLGAQISDIESQHFKGVRKFFLFHSVKDTSGKIITPKSKIRERDFDTSGLLLEMRSYEKGLVTLKQTYKYDSLGRLISEIYWTPKKQEQYTYRYSYNAKTKAEIREKRSGLETISIQASWKDDKSGDVCTTVWNGSLMSGAPTDKFCRGENGELTYQKTFLGYDMFRYDSLGNVEEIVVRHEKNGKVTAVIPSRIVNIYEGGHLKSAWQADLKLTFTYTSGGLIKTQSSRSSRTNTLTLFEAEYMFY